MNKDDEKMAIATFRFGLISEFVTGVRLSYGEREKLLKEKTARGYQIPGSTKIKVCRSTILAWVHLYKKGGFRIEALYPKARVDKGKCRALTPELRLAIKELKKQKPSLKLPALLTELKHRKLIAQDEVLNSSTIYRYLKNENIISLNEDATDKRLFEAEMPNEIWQSDVMHGPRIVDGEKHKKAYLMAIMDDHSRLIVHGQFYLGETIENFRDCLKQAVQSRGLPQKLYVDNGACFKALHLAHIGAALGIAIKHSRPYTPQGRGKIERWFKYIRDNFLPHHESGKESLKELNCALENWVYDYNNKIHGTTKQTPYHRYKQNLQCVRPAPQDLMNYFRHVEFRHVKKDRTFRLEGFVFEAPVHLIDRFIELKYHPDQQDKVEIFFNGLSYGCAVLVNAAINSKIGRNWKPHELRPSREQSKAHPESQQITVPLAGGELFNPQLQQEEKP